MNHVSYVAVSELVPGLPGDAQLAGTCSSVAAAACFSSPRPFCAPGTLGFDEVAGRVIFALKSATQIAWIQMRLSCLCKMRFFLLIVDSSCEFQECGLSGPVSSECLFFNALLWVFLVHRTL